MVNQTQDSNYLMVKENTKAMSPAKNIHPLLSWNLRAGQYKKNSKRSASTYPRPVSCVHFARQSVTTPWPGQGSHPFFTPFLFSPLQVQFYPSHMPSTNLFSMCSLLPFCRYLSKSPLRFSAASLPILSFAESVMLLLAR